MLGMDMMLKSMGIDPEDIKKQVEQFSQLVIELKAQMDRIEAGQIQIQNAIEELKNGKPE